MTSPFFGEFMGTMVLILMGDGVVANVLLKKSKAEGAGWITITAGWCFAVLAGIYTAQACGSADAHLNPAVTLGFAVVTGDGTKIAPYIAAQMLGAFAGGTLVWLHFLPHWKETPDKAMKLAVFCNAPAIRSPASNMLSEIIATFALVFVIACIAAKAAAGSVPALVSCLVWGVGLSLGGPTGYAINPARDLGPRLAHFILPVAGKGHSDWEYAAIPVFGPLIGGGLAGALVRCIKF
jgi:glycerol uptake facilitator protein